MLFHRIQLSTVDVRPHTDTLINNNYPVTQTSVWGVCVRAAKQTWRDLDAAFPVTRGCMSPVDNTVSQSITHGRLSRVEYWQNTTTSKMWCTRVELNVSSETSTQYKNCLYDYAWLLSARQGLISAHTLSIGRNGTVKNVGFCRNNIRLYVSNQGCLYGSLLQRIIAQTQTREWVSE